GLSAGLVDAVQLNPELGQVGKPVASDGRLLHLLVNEFYLPVVACVAGDRNGAIFNVNGDQMAVACAQGFSADQLIFLTDVEGVRDPSGEVCSQLTAEQGLQLISSGVATGGMQAKIEAATTALRNGVQRVRIAPGSCRGILSQILAGSPLGTEFILG
ncbi:MAG: acetylglutamate kinase, partial [Acidobacteriota bacterium]|nr:acetylglutamate kinase [Acidobacteriota bacterium]